MKRLPAALLRAAFGLALVVIFVLAMIPVAVVPELMSNQDKLHHSAAFATLMLLGRGGWPARLGLVALGLLGYGILIELCQHAFTTNRVGELRDVIADSLGIALGWLLARPWRMAAT
ncbi:MAG: VanZ family protein [Zoogloea sp.]|nr:VanZ family protein [Zoogloea sp.]